MSTHNTRMAWSGIALGVTLLAATAACSKSSSATNDLDRLEMNVAQAQMAKGTVTHLDAIGVYHDATSRKVSDVAMWRSSDEQVAVVVGAGLVKGVSEGVATIRAEVGSLSAATTVRVTPAELTGLEMSRPSVALPVGLAAQLNAIGRFTDLTTQDLTTQAEWSSSLPSVATVEKGLVVAVGQGAAVITARVAGHAAATAAAVATPTLVAGIRVEPPDKAIPWGIPQQLDAWAHMTEGPDQKITNQVVWSSSDPSIADFRPGSPGLLDTNKKEGCKAAGASCDVMVTASLEYSRCTASYGCATSTKLFVSNILVTSIRIDPRPYSMPLGVHKQFNAVGTFTDGNEYPVTEAVDWTVTDPAVASVANQPGGRGLVESLAAGSARVVGAMNGWVGGAPGAVQAEAPLTVTDAALVGIRVSPDLFSCRECGSLPVGLTRQFRAFGTFAGIKDEVEITQDVTWTSDAPAHAIVSNMHKGLVTAVQDRDVAVQIIATCPRTNTTGAYDLKIIRAQIMKLALSPSTASRPRGITQSFKATATFTDNHTEDYTSFVRWEIAGRPAGAAGDSAPATIALDSAGSRANFKSFLGSSLGDYKVSASTDSVACPACPGFFAPQATMTVTPAALSRLAVTPYEVWTPANVMPLMFHLPMKATGTYTDGSQQDLTASAEWTLANKNALDLTKYAELVPSQPGTVDSLQPTYSPPLPPVSSSGFTVKAKAGDLVSGYDLHVAPYTLMAIEVKSDLPVDSHVPDLSPHYNLPKGLSAEFRAYGDYGDAFQSAMLTGVNHKFDISHMTTWEAHNYVNAPAFPVVAAIQCDAAVASPHADVSAVELGFSTISAEDALHTGDRGEVDLHATDAVPVRIAIAPVEASIGLGMTHEFIASVYYSDAPQAAVLNPAGVLFGLASCSDSACSPSPDTVATVLDGAHGRIQGIGQGRVSVVASMPGCRPANAGDCDPVALLTVKDAQLKSIRIEPASLAIPLGSSAPLRAWGTFTSGPSEVDITMSATWDSADHETVLVSNDAATKGVAIGLRMGGPIAVGATMKDPFSGDFIYGGAAITVAERAITAIEVVAEVQEGSPTCPYQVEAAKTLQFRAHAHYSDGFVEDSPAVVWESSDPGVATIDAAGLATGVASGEVDVHARHLASGVIGGGRLKVNCPQVSCQASLAAR